MLKRVPHPFVALRNFLNDCYLPPADRLVTMAQQRGLSLHSSAPEAEPPEPIKLDRTRFAKIAPQAVGSSTLARMALLLDSMSVPFFYGGSDDAWTPCINVTQTDLPTVIAILANWFAPDPNLFIAAQDGTVQSVESFAATARSTRPRSFHMLCVEPLKAQQRTHIKPCSQILINVWSEATHYDQESVFESAVENPFVGRMREHSILNLQDGHKDIADVSPPLRARVDFPIDVVYTWVNDQDTEWLNLKSSYAGVKSNGRAHHDERFRNRDELKYSLRSIEMFAPFVRNIYLVTNGQIPEWLNLDHPQIKVVTHADIYKNAGHLPTFNSSGIETQLHHIEGLSEHFIYFNDDFFLGSFCTPEDFFHPNGVMKYFPSEQRVYEPDVDDKTEEYLLADVNALALIRREHETSNVEIMKHVPYPSSKTLLSRMEEKFETQFNVCAASRFRSSKDIRPIAFMQYHFGYQERLALPSSISHRYLALWKPTIDKQFEGVAKTRKYKTICINDVGVESENIEATDKLVYEFLNGYFPFKSSYEV